jgi:hypothetical protein
MRGDRLARRVSDAEWDVTGQSLMWKSVKVNRCVVPLVSTTSTP